MAEDDAALRDVLWKMYQEHCTQGRHHEVQRSTVASVLLAIVAVVIGLITNDQKITNSDIPLTLFLLVLGMFGAVFSAKHYERFELHMESARRYRDELDTLLPGAPLKRLKRAADDKHNGKYPRLKDLRLNRFWIGIYLITSGLGLVLFAIAALSQK